MDPIAEKAAPPGIGPAEATGGGALRIIARAIASAAPAGARLAGWARSIAAACSLRPEQPAARAADRRVPPQS